MRTAAFLAFLFLKIVALKDTQAFMLAFMIIVLENEEFWFDVD